MRTEEKTAAVEEQAARPAGRPRPPRMTRARLWLLGSTAAVYVAIVVGVLSTSWLVRLDWQLMLFRPYKQWPEVHAFLDYFVVLGQRGPTALAVLCWLGYCAWRQHSLRPVLVLGTALLLLNLTVGAAKIGMGRLGPHYATQIGSNEMWLGGDIFPSGHTANAVVTWGVLAYVAATPVARRIASVISALVSLGVGLTTVYLGTHWISDVLLGWAAGLLILLALPWFEPWMHRAEDLLPALWRRLRSSLRPVPAPALQPLSTRVAIISQRAGVGAPQAAFGPGENPLPEMAGVGARPAGPPALERSRELGEGWPHHPARPHIARHERTPVTPTGPRRPPYPDRSPRPQTRAAGGPTA
ncbi:phosphatase PAP2 family protein [Streptomyces sp. NPDC051940]|uniref:phosphatase PAP2 family protein n=1 Tax=Streptomyces sp. NPDC051940 TaxID=3155675 RepID=UPI0034226456